MIAKEIVKVGEKMFLHTWSDAGYMIIRDGIQYEEAYDPVDSERVYIETNIPVSSVWGREAEQALNILLGVE